MKTHKRTFLTGPEADSYIRFNVETTEAKLTKHGACCPEIIADLKIADCFRTIHLDFGRYGTKEGKNNLKKLYKLSDTLDEFILIVEKAHKEYDDQLSHFKELKKEYNASKSKSKRKRTSIEP